MGGSLLASLAEGKGIKKIRRSLDLVLKALGGMTRGKRSAKKTRDDRNIASLAKREARFARNIVSLQIW